MEFAIPAGGVLVVSNGTAGTEAAFKTAWNLGGDVSVVATGGPGLGGNDAVIVFDASNNVIVPLGEKDYSSLLADFSDQDRGINLATGKPVSGLYMPDAITSFSAGGNTYYITANEGDSRNDFQTETTTVANAGDDLDDTLFPNEAALKANTSLGRLVVSNSLGLRGDGDIDRILSYGGHSISILDSTGTRIYGISKQASRKPRARSSIALLCPSDRLRALRPPSGSSGWGFSFS
jgi:hypothetical protein